MRPIGEFAGCIVTNTPKSTGWHWYVVFMLSTGTVQSASYPRSEARPIRPQMQLAEAENCDKQLNQRGEHPLPQSTLKPSLEVAATRASNKSSNILIKTETKCNKKCKETARAKKTYISDTERSEI